MSLPVQTLGRTGLEVTRIGFGGAPLGLSGYLGGGDRTAAARQREGMEAVEAAVAAGITYFDTAPGYGNGLSERLFGKALAPMRDRVVLATKVRYDPDATAAQLDAEVEASLTRLQTGYVDVLQIHGSQYTNSFADRMLASGFLDWLTGLKQRGIARAVGLSAETPSGALERLVDSGRFDVLQIAYSLIYHGACDYQRQPFGIIPYARERGLGIVTMRAATSGVLPRLFEQAFPEISQDRVAEASIEFVLSTPEVDCALVGMRDAGEVVRNLVLARRAPRFDLAQLHNFYPNGKA
ncbi:aldo/keto reductase [Devosia nitrariae]|uniref:NADP-dependent oxidoreductase domain-containing protein n=1 Tax=Devosia nitrariae TaxID=2071872 RepID=A0ABQ5W6D1_9HYPH|nr:aldo/keto reductase [Devosia nitrariae]GLQ55603.1 hypothetical protein GCM10010862_28620 [Devosia nitrariae]